MRLVLITCLLLTALSVHPEETIILDQRIETGTHDYSLSLRRESDRRFKVLITVPELKGDWRYSDFELEVFDRKNRKLPAHPARKPDAPLVTARTRSPGRSHALYTLNTEVPARATLRVKGKAFELTFDPSKLPEN